MRLIHLSLVPLVLLGALAAQDPNPPKPPETVPPKVVPPEQVPPEKVPPVVVESGKQDPVVKVPGGDKPADGAKPKDGQKPQEGQKPKDGEQPAEGAKPADGEKPSTTDDSEIELPEDTPIPVSADPADLRAMRSAQDMMAAERRMRALIKAGKLKDIDKLVSFEELSSWPYEDGLKGTPKAVRELDGKNVLMTGFMLPIDEVENIREFLLVQSLWACCYGQPPDINGIVRVVMKGDARCDYQFDPIKVTGTFRVQETREDGYCIDIFQLHADSVGLIR